VGVIAQEDYKVFSFRVKIQGLALMVLSGNFLVEDILFESTDGACALFIS
jgi:hypothetical protein